MNRNAILVSILIIVILIVGGAYLAFGTPHAQAPTSDMASSTATGIHNEVRYACDSAKTMEATYTDNQVVLVLSDGRSLTLPQVPSGSGIRYEQGAGTGSDIVLSGKGSDAFLTENGKTIYDNCVENAAPAGSTNGMSTFIDAGKTFSFMYPSTFTVSGGGVSYTQSWMNNATTSGLLLAKLIVPKSFEPGTNFGDATFTVGTSADSSAVATCLTSNPSGGPATASSKQTIHGVTYTVFTSSDAGAGNRYQTTSYRTVRNSQCYAVEYTVHSSAIENYPAGTVTAFDQAKVMQVFTGIVQSVTFL